MRKNIYIKMLIAILTVLIAFVISGCTGEAPEPPPPESPPPLDGTPTTPNPTPTPSSTPTPPPAQTPTPTPEPTPEPEPEPPPPHPATLFKPYFIEETDPSAEHYRFTYDIMVDGKIVDEYIRPVPIFFGTAEEYTELEGITTFRGNNFRNAAFWGTVNVTQRTLTRNWQIPIGSCSRNRWTGVGWNGQPAIVRWDEETRRIMNIYPDKKDKDGLIEVIYAAMDGLIRFLDLDDGTPTRDPISVRDPIKGSVSVDPRGYPLMYVGQGISYGSPMGFRVFSLITGKELLFINGSDSFCYRRWRAFDSNALVDGAADTLIIPGENGVLYTAYLGTEYDKEAGTITLDPEIIRYRYRSRLVSEPGTESSVTGFANYLLYGDNSGLIQCVDLNTMTPVWIMHNTDDTDSTPLIDIEEDGSVSLYVACEVDKQGNGGRGYIRKLDAVTGETLWEHSYPCAYDSSVNGGILASPIIGRGDLEGGIIYFVAKVRTGQGAGVLVNLDKMTGEVIWETWFSRYGWSSPVAVYTETGKSYIIVCDAGGNMHLLEGATGEKLTSIPLGGNIEGSPAIFENRIVVGTRTQRIYCIEIG